jgi:RNase P subunit RPR2
MSPPAAERLEAESMKIKKTPVRARNIARRGVIRVKDRWKKELCKSTDSQGVLFSQLQAACLNYTLNPC